MGMQGQQHEKHRHSMQQHSEPSRGPGNSLSPWPLKGARGHTYCIPGCLKLLLGLGEAVEQSEAGAAHWHYPGQGAQAQRTGTLCCADAHQAASGLPADQESTAAAKPLASLLGCLQVETVLVRKGSNWELKPVQYKASRTLL